MSSNALLKKGFDFALTLCKIGQSIGVKKNCFLKLHFNIVWSWELISDMSEIQHDVTINVVSATSPGTKSRLFLLLYLDIFWTKFESTRYFKNSGDIVKFTGNGF